MAPSSTRSLVIVGKRTKRTGKPVLDGKDKARVLTIKRGVKVSIRSLVVRNGRATRVRAGGGISNKGKLTLRDVVVRGNGATRGGGIFNAGVLRMLGRSIVRGNTGTGRAPMSVGGLYNVGFAVLDDSARIRKNNMGTIVVVNKGTLTMRGASDISDNSPFHGPSGTVVNQGTMVMDGTAGISGQGGVSNAGTLVMNGASSIHDNTTSGCVATLCGPAGRPGAGVFNTGSLALNDTASIHHNRVFGAQSPEYPGARGGGVYNEGTVTMTGSSRIHENEAQLGGNGVQGLGGGLFSTSGGTLVGVNCAPQSYANVYGNAPDDCYLE